MVFVALHFSRNHATMRLSIVFALLVSAAACHDSSTQPEPVAGRYALQSPLPHTVGSTTYTGSTLTLTDGGTCEARATVTYNGNTGQTDTVPCSWTSSGATVSVTIGLAVYPLSAGANVLTRSGRELVTRDGARYAKQ